MTRSCLATFSSSFFQVVLKICVMRLVLFQLPNQNFVTEARDERTQIYDFAEVNITDIWNCKSGVRRLWSRLAPVTEWRSQSDEDVQQDYFWRALSARECYGTCAKMLKSTPAAWAVLIVRPHPYERQLYSCFWYVGRAIFFSIYVYYFMQLNAVCSKQVIVLYGQSVPNYQ